MINAWTCLFPEELTEALLELGIENAEFREGELWVYFGQKKKGNGEQLAIHRGCGQVSLQTTLWLGRWKRLVIALQGKLFRLPWKLEREEFCFKIWSEMRIPEPGGSMSD